MAFDNSRRPRDAFHSRMKAGEVPDWFGDPEFLDRITYASLDFESIFALVRMLSARRYERILDLGMGFSSAIYSRYARHTGADHVVVENNRAWADYFMKDPAASCISPDSVHIMGISEERDSKRKVKSRKYAGFSDEAARIGKFDFVSIDGPVGYDVGRPRTDVLDFGPDLLSDVFTVFQHDIDRQNDLSVFNETYEKLRRSKKGVYRIMLERCGFITNVGLLQ